MTPDRLDWLNVGLMILAATAAVFAPFQTFLLAYAVFGPLHYLTEISWLHNRNLFTPRASSRTILVLLVAATSIIMLYGYVRAELLHHSASPTWEIGMFLLVFAAAAAAQYAQHPASLIELIVMAGIGISVWSGSRLTIGNCATPEATVKKLLRKTTSYIHNMSPPTTGPP
jgi:hypothetical protein